MAPSLSPVVTISAVLVVLAVLYQSLAPLPTPAIKLTYFDVPGRAEATRVALRLGGVAFEDERLTRDAFLQLKPTLPFGQVPVLTVDGEVFAESQAILRYAGRVAGLYPTDNAVATLLVEEILTAVDEISETQLTPTRRETDPEKQKHMRDTLVAGPLPASLAKLDARLKSMRNLPYFKASNDKVFLHEVAVWRFVTSFKSATLDHMPTTITDSYATVSAIHAKVAAAIATLPTQPTPPLQEAFKIQRPTSLQLSYFDIEGRAQPLRLALHIGGVAFDDERLARDAFLARKPTLPYGQVPVLTVDAVTVAQTFALLRYAGALSGLYPVNNPVEALKIDEIIARVEDVYYAFAPSGAEQDQDKKRAIREQLVADRIPKTLALLDKRVAQWRQLAAFTLGNEISVADLAVLSLVQFFKSGHVDFVAATVVDKYETLIAVNDAVLAHPRVQDWYAQTK